MKNLIKYALIIFAIFAVSFIGGFVGMNMHIEKAYADVGRMKFVESAGPDLYIYKDTITGVHYLMYSEKMGYGGAGGICVLVDKEGKPLVTKEYNVKWTN